MRKLSFNRRYRKPEQLLKSVVYVLICPYPASKRDSNDKYIVMLYNLKQKNPNSLFNGAKISDYKTVRTASLRARSKQQIKPTEHKVENMNKTATKQRYIIAYNYIRTRKTLT